MAIAAALSEVHDGKEKVLVFGSRCLSAAEWNYCTTRLKLLAVYVLLQIIPGERDQTMEIVEKYEESH